MLTRPWIIRFAAIALIGASCAFAAVPGAQADPARPAAAGPARVARSRGPSGSLAWSGAMRAAAIQPAPLVSDSGAPRSKTGLAAPATTASMARANALKQAQARRFLQVRQGRVVPAGKCTSRACRARMPVARDLAATQRPQTRDYFCGPATVSEMLAQMGVRLAQWRAARQLGTTPSGTDWSDASGYPVPEVLNKNQNRNVYVAVALPWSPTARQVRTYEIDLVTDINHNGGAPLAGNAYEVPGGPHLVGNPLDQTIFHWFDIRGYRDSGAVTDYEDSVHGASSIGWSGAVPAYSSLSSATIVDIVGARGYDW
jgi:hypothetical protein